MTVRPSSESVPPASATGSPPAAASVAEAGGAATGLLKVTARNLPSSARELRTLYTFGAPFLPAAVPSVRSLSRRASATRTLPACVCRQLLLQSTAVGAISWSRSTRTTRPAGKPPFASSSATCSRIAAFRAVRVAFWTE